MKPVFSLLLITTLYLFHSDCGSSAENNPLHKAFVIDSLRIADSVEHIRIINKAAEAKIFCTKNKYATDFCLLMDMKIHSGLYRFFVWDFTSNSAIDSGLVSHGCGNNLWGHDDSKTNPVFSNVYESHCSSLGKYKIGERGYSNWGIHVNYAMYGLDSTNSNSFGRNICMHSWDMISDEETFPAGTPEGWGCAAVSENFMRRLDSLLQPVSKSVLLWIFNE